MLFLPLLALAAAPLDRAEFNARAVELGSFVFWRADENKNGKPDPSEVVTLWGAPRRPELERAIAAVVAAEKSDLGANEDEARRRALIKRELRQAQSALVLTRTRTWSDAERAFTDKMLEAAMKIDALYAKQMGALELEPQLEGEPAASRSLFFRNHGPWCVMPATEKLPQCNAIASLPPKLSALYPSALQARDGFCDALLKHRFARALAHPFSVVRGEGDALKPIPYHIVFSGEMDAVALSLRDAAGALQADEGALKTYLLAAAQAFRDNQWAVADEAWLKTTASRFYLRVAPDETYADPCARKATFALTFGRQNAAARAWQERLAPLLQTMEDAVAKLAGPPYKARPPGFKLPDFIDVIVAAGDARLPFGATIGQSLPIFGKVAAEGRRRTVAMTNLFVDDDSAALQRKQAESVFCPAALEGWTDSPEPKLMSTLLHEVSHNLGPGGFYQVNGKGLPQIFGPSTSLVLNELHAQSAALLFTDWLSDQGHITPAFAASAHQKDLMFALEQISRGLTGADGKPKPYGALSAIQVAALLRAGALVWRAGETAANKSDTGCLAVAQGTLKTAISQLTERVLRIRATGDKSAADALLDDALSDKAPHAALFRTVAERFGRFPKISFVYAVEP